MASLIAVLGLAFCPNQTKAQEVEDVNKVYSFTSIDNPPTFPGGMDVFYKFLGDNIKYPEKAAKEKVQGNVFASFTVTKTGAIQDIKIERKLGAGTDEEAVRVLKLSPNWNPGTIEGQPVNVKYNIPIKFALVK